jgi:hypothetical protein
LWWALLCSQWRDEGLSSLQECAKAANFLERCKAQVRGRRPISLHNHLANLVVQPKAKLLLPLCIAWVNTVYRGVNIVYSLTLFLALPSSRSSQNTKRRSSANWRSQRSGTLQLRSCRSPQRYSTRTGAALTYTLRHGMGDAERILKVCRNR